MKFFYSTDEGYEIDCSEDEVSETFSHQLHSHDDIYEVLYVEEGNASFWVEGNDYKIEAGDLVITRSDEMHQMRHHTKTYYKRLVININVDFFEINGCPSYTSVFNDRHVGVGNYFSAKTVRENGLSEILDKIKKYAQIDEKPLVRSSLVELLYLLNKLPDRETAETRGVIQDVVLYINENITHSLSLDTIAEKFYISKYYLCRQFKKRIGMSIGKYITHKRLLIVKESYSAGKNLTEACIAAGFGDYSSFYVAYKKINGDSPKNILK